MTLKGCTGWPWPSAVCEEGSSLSDTLVLLSCTLPPFQAYTVSPTLRNPTPCFHEGGHGGRPWMCDVSQEYLHFERGA